MKRMLVHPTFAVKQNVGEPNIAPDDYGVW